MFGGAGRNRIAIEGFCRPLPSHFGYRAFCYSVLADALPQFSAQKDRLRILFHWSLFLLAMELQSHEGFVVADSQFPLQNARAARDELPCFQFH
jgi:hypothetical protein